MKSRNPSISARRRPEAVSAADPRVGVPAEAAEASGADLQGETVAARAATDLPPAARAARAESSGSGAATVTADLSRPAAVRKAATPRAVSAPGSARRNA